MKYKQRIQILALSMMLAGSEALGESGRCYNTFDPYEKFNRGTFNLNRAVDRTFFRPAVKTYYYFMPTWGHERVMNFFHNVAEPLSFVNYAFQGKSAECSKTIWRFLINSTFGLAGLFDPASRMGITTKQQGFSDTMAQYKINYGMYIVVPVLGPSTTRNVYGTVVDVFSDPVGILIAKTKSYKDFEVYGLTITAYKRVRHDAVLDSIDESSLDLYSKTRDMYLQSIAARDDSCEQDEPTIRYDNVEE